MITIVLFIFAMVGFAYWWLWRQRVLDKPWAEVGPEARYARRDRQDFIGSQNRPYVFPRSRYQRFRLVHQCLFFAHGVARLESGNETRGALD